MLRLKGDINQQDLQIVNFHIDQIRIIVTIKKTLEENKYR